jgi:chromatin segregation and condensation protein Rec8/ScpA/Scc1 (kleisin family)
VTSPSAHPGPPTAALGADPGFVVQLDAFSGPLDLLLHLLREEQVEIADIPIARIADQFLASIHQMGLNQAADYLEMAGRLLRLKAQMLLPRPSEDDWEDPRHELVRRLLEYQQIKEIVSWFERSAERRALQYGRGYIPPAPELEALLADMDRTEFNWREALGLRPTIVDVLSTFLALLELAKRGLLTLHQPAQFADMVIRRDTPSTVD